MTCRRGTYALRHVAIAQFSPGPHESSGSSTPSGGGAAPYVTRTSPRPGHSGDRWFRIAEILEAKRHDVFDRGLVRRVSVVLHQLPDPVGVLFQVIGADVERRHEPTRQRLDRLTHHRNHVVSIEDSARDVAVHVADTQWKHERGTPHDRPRAARRQRVFVERGRPLRGVRRNRVAAAVTVASAAPATSVVTHAATISSASVIAAPAPTRP